MRLLSVLAAGLLIGGLPAARMGDGAILFEVEAPAEAQAGGLSEAGFRAYLPQLRAQAERSGVSRTTLDRVFSTLVFSARTVELDRAQPGGPPGSTIPAFAP